MRAGSRFPIFVTFIICAVALRAFGQHGDTADLSAKQLQPAEGLKVDVFAADPLFVNPVAFTVDEKGRFFVSETHRYKDAIFDLWRMDERWKTNDFSWRTVEDREKFLRREFATNINFLTKDSELIRLVEDKDGDGHADSSSVFAEGFNKVTAGTAAGVLASHGELWFTCIPDLWKFKYDASGKKLSQEVLHTGYGVHISVSGHDLHGLVMGPDGRLYFSVGDRGANVRTKEGKQLEVLQRGAVFRCNPDGSNLEIFAIGLRNPQELAFDEYGNLWAHDNDTSGDDKSRVMHVVEGGEYGWRQSYQFMEDFGPWVKEKVWEGNVDDVLPPAGYGAQGPSGLAFYPGVGLPEKYRGVLIGCDFPQGIWAYFKKPKGASYEITREKLLWGFGATDAAFGPDGALYASDWGKSYNMPNAGRIYRLIDPAQNTTALAELKKLLAEGMEQRSIQELTSLLSHADMRVRLDAQFELENRAIKSLILRRTISVEGGLRAINDTLSSVATGSTNQLSRIHAIWALGNISRKGGTPVVNVLTNLTKDTNAEIRAQVANQLTESVVESILSLLHDPNPRVQASAATALGRFQKLAATKKAEAATQLFKLAERNNDKDPFVRHAVVFSLVNIGDTNALQTAAKSENPAVRHAALLCMRRLKLPAIAQFLTDADQRVNIEAIRAINDVPIQGAMEDLANRMEDCKCDMPMELRKQAISRAINANYRLGKPENYAHVINFLLSAKAPEDMRVEALNALAEWEQPYPMDRIIGLWRPLNRVAKINRAGFSPVLDAFMNSSVEKISLAALRCGEKLNMTNLAPSVFSIVQKMNAPATVRIRALQTLGNFRAPQMRQAVALSLVDTNSGLRAEAITWAAQLNAKEAVPLLQNVLATATDLRLRQSALAALGNISDESAVEILSHQVEQLLNGKLQPELQLETIEAASKHTSSILTGKLKQYESSFSQADLIAPWRASLAGGDAARGKKIFQENDAVGCLRCHAVNSRGGVVGPDLKGVASRHPREYLLESIVLPNQQIAPGFESATIKMKAGPSYAGIVKSETDGELVLNSPEDGLLTLKKNEIEKRDRSLSAMPEGLGTLLSKRDLRDLVEYLSTLK